MDDTNNYHSFLSDNTIIILRSDNWCLTSSKTTKLKAFTTLNMRLVLVAKVEPLVQSIGTKYGYQSSVKSDGS